MFGIGSAEFIVIIIVAILVLGPEHLPKIIRTITKVTSDFRRVSTELQRAINLDSFQEPESRPSSKKTTKKTVKAKKQPPAEPTHAKTAAPPSSETMAENQDHVVEPTSEKSSDIQEAQQKNSDSPTGFTAEIRDDSKQNPDERSTV